MPYRVANTSFLFFSIPARALLYAQFVPPLCAGLFAMLELLIKYDMVMEATLTQPQQPQSPPHQLQQVQLTSTLLRCDELAEDAGLTHPLDHRNTPSQSYITHPHYHHDTTSLLSPILSIIHTTPSTGHELNLLDGVMERLTATLCDILDAPSPFNCPLITLQQSVQFVVGLLTDLPVELGVSLPHILTIATVLVRQGGDIINHL